MSGEKKVAYHSELRGLGPFKVKVLSEPLASVKKKGEFYVELEIQGRKRYMHPENEACLEFWRGQKGNEFTVVAEGDRDDAKFVYVGESGKSLKEPAAKKEPSRTQATQKPPTETTQAAKPPPPERTAPEGALVAMKKFVARNRTLSQIATKAAMSQAEEFTKEYGIAAPPILIVEWFKSALYGSSHTGLIERLPLKIDFKTLKVIDGGKGE